MNCSHYLTKLAQEKIPHLYLIMQPMLWVQAPERLLAALEDLRQD